MADEQEMTTDEKLASAERLLVLEREGRAGEREESDQLAKRLTAVRSLWTEGEYHEDEGNVLWYDLPVAAPPFYVGPGPGMSPLDGMRDPFRDKDVLMIGWQRFVQPGHAMPGDPLDA